MAPETCKDMLKKLREKFRAKFPATKRDNSIVKIALLNVAFFKDF